MTKKFKTWIHDFKTDPTYFIVIFLSGVVVYGIVGFLLLSFFVHVYHKIL